MIIDNSYFWGGLKLYLPSSKVGNAAALSTIFNDELTLFVKKYENQFLKNIFGEQEYEPYRSFLIDPEFKTSPIANYVFYYYFMSKDTDVDASGTYKHDRESGSVISNTSRAIPVWNEMIKMLLPLFDKLMDDGMEIQAGWSEFLNDDFSGVYKNDYGL